MINEGGNALFEDNVTNNEYYSLRLFVAGASHVSVRAITNLQKILDEHLKGRYQLDIIDVHQQPLLVRGEDVTAIPTLIKNTPGPKRKLVGDMSDTAKVLRGLGLT